jgi:hypothetical protein
MGDPLTTATTVKDFLELDLDVQAMVGQVDPLLYRNRRT